MLIFRKFNNWLSIQTSVTNNTDKARPWLDKFLKHINPVRLSTALVPSLKGIDIFQSCYPHSFLCFFSSCSILSYSFFNTSAELFCSLSFLLILLNKLNRHAWMALRSESSRHDINWYKLRLKIWWISKISNIIGFFNIPFYLD